MPQSKSTPKSTPKPKTREAGLAKAANDYALGTAKVSFGAPVSANQIAFYEQAIKAVRKSKTLAQFLGFPSNEKALRQLRPVATGSKRASQLPKETRDAFDKLYARLTLIHDAAGAVNKTWPRKHAIVLVALLNEKPARKPAAKKQPNTEPQAAPVPAAA